MVEGKHLGKSLRSIFGSRHKKRSNPSLLGWILWGSPILSLLARRSLVWATSQFLSMQTTETGALPDRVSCAPSACSRTYVWSMPSRLYLSEVDIRHIWKWEQYCNKGFLALFVAIEYHHLFTKAFLKSVSVLLCDLIVLPHLLQSVWLWFWVEDVDRLKSCWVRWIGGRLFKFTVEIEEGEARSCY